VSAYLDEELERHLEGADPIEYLRFAAAVIYLQLADGVRVAEADRRFAEEAVRKAGFRGLKPLDLTEEQIAKLFADDEESD
jgi:hypothetical protein